MYLINLACSCQVELSPAHKVPVFHHSNRCNDEHDPRTPYINSRIATQIIDTVGVDEAIAEFDFDADELELTGTEIFH